MYQCGTNNVDIGPYGLCWSVGRMYVNVGPTMLTLVHVVCVGL